MPDRERDLIAIFQDAASRYAKTRTAAQKSNVRLSLEVELSRFTQTDQLAHDWVGVIRTVHSTPEGDRWMAIEIAPDVIFSTFDSRFSDRFDLTLIRPYSKLWDPIETLKVGEPVYFDATMLVFDVSNDDDMVRRRGSLRVSRPCGRSIRPNRSIPINKSTASARSPSPATQSTASDQRSHHPAAQNMNVEVRHFLKAVGPIDLAISR